MRFLDPRNDIAFKKVFGEHKTLCISLLNALLPLPADAQIESIEYLDTHVLPMEPGEKDSAVDVSCKDTNGRQFLVEMQLYWTPSFMPRALLNSAKAYARQSYRGMNYSELQPVYSLCLLNEVFMKEHKYDNDFMHTYTISHDKYHNIKIEGMTFVFVELPKFRSVNRAHNKMAQLWLTFLNETVGKESLEEMDPELTSNDLIKQAIEILKVSSFSGSELASYEKKFDDISIHVSSLSDATRIGEEVGMRKGLEKGEKIGLEKGEKIGLEKGLEEGEKIGREKGLEEGERLGKVKEAEQIASNMKRMGLAAETIAKATGLSPEAIDAL